MFLLFGLLAIGMLAASIDFSPTLDDADIDANQSGGNGDDTLEGTASNDLLIGEGGDDVLSGNDGDDLLYGRDGNDTMSGGAGNDTIRGASGDDAASGGAGNDVIFLDSGNDYYQDFFEDLPDESLGDDSIEGGSGNDLILSGNGEDTIMGGSGHDTLADLGGASTVDGGNGMDVVAAFDEIPNTENGDVLIGGQGWDTLGGDAGDTMTGGEDRDLFTFETDTSHNGNADILRITDFKLGEDILQITAPDYEADDLTAIAAHNPDHTLLQFKGETIAILENTDAQAIASALDDNLVDVFRIVEA